MVATPANCGGVGRGDAVGASGRRRLGVCRVVGISNGCCADWGRLTTLGQDDGLEPPQLAGPAARNRSSPPTGAPHRTGGGVPGRLAESSGSRVTDRAAVLDGRARELERRLMGLRGRARVVPVEEDSPSDGIPVRRGRLERGVRTQAARGRRRRRRRRAGSADRRATSRRRSAAASIALRKMKPSAGGLDDLPEKRLTARSNDPHQALTGVERPRYGARRAASTCAARVAIAKYVATRPGS